jgi:hypothetical protein
MSSPLFDDNGVRQSSVQRDQYKFASEGAAAAKEGAAAAKEGAAAAKQNAKFAALSNDELVKLNRTAEAIATANAQLVAMQSQAIDEASKQTALLDAQLQISKIGELEKNRQIQIKQAAFSVEQKIKKFTSEQNIFTRYFHLKDQDQQVSLVSLTADAPNEIADKKYVSEILSGLNQAINEAKTNLSKLQIEDVEKYYKYSNELAEANGLASYYSNLLTNFSFPEKMNKTSALLMGLFMPKLISKKEHNNIAVIIYWISIYYTYGASLVVGLGMYSTESKKFKKASDDADVEYQVLKENLKNAEKSVVAYNDFFEYFKNAYSLP